MQKKQGLSMLFPKNPKVIPGLWESAKSQMIRNKMLFLIRDGMPCYPLESGIMSETEAEAWIEKLKKLPVVRFSSNREITMSPHFACNLDDSGIRMVELVTFPFDGGWENLAELQKILSISTLALLYEKNAAKDIVIPIHLPSWSMDGINVQEVQDGLLFRKVMMQTNG